MNTPPAAQHFSKGYDTLSHNLGETAPDSSHCASGSTMQLETENNIPY